MKSLYLEESTSSWIEDDSYVSGLPTSYGAELALLSAFVEGETPKIFFPDTNLLFLPYYVWDGSTWTFDLERPHGITKYTRGSFAVLDLGDSINTFVLGLGMDSLMQPLPVFDGGEYSDENYLFPEAPAVVEEEQSSNSNGLSIAYNLPTTVTNERESSLEDDNNKIVLLFVLVIVALIYFNNKQKPTRKRRVRGKKK